MSNIVEVYPDFASASAVCDKGYQNIELSRVSLENPRGSSMDCSQHPARMKYDLKICHAVRDGFNL
jgi:hypothetical protein